MRRGKSLDEEDDTTRRSGLLKFPVKKVTIPITPIRTGTATQRCQGCDKAIINPYLRESSARAALYPMINMRKLLEYLQVAAKEL